ncbi:MAG: hypothetical protein EA425_14345 [Puniceicoccaceae bacterium]|nr:MAG: hypothetical protein EA425_14345 [Puniceicoccaceae bacterium]
MAGKDPPWLPGRPDDAEEHPVDPQWITLRRLGNLIRTTILGLMGLTGTLIFLGLVGWSSAAKLTFLAGVAGFFCALYILGMITPVLAYRRYRWRLDGETLLVRRGIWWRIETLVPKSRIQHTDVTQGPLERLFHTSSLVVHTAGTRFAIVEVDGLPTGLAPKMRDHLLDLRPDESL